MRFSKIGRCGFLYHFDFGAALGLTSDLPEEPAAVHRFGEILNVRNFLHFVSENL